MGAREVTATEFARNLSSLLNEVRYQGVSLEVRRGKEIIARVIPPAEAVGLPAADLGLFFASLPRLGKRDSEAFLADLESLDRTLALDGDAWDS